MCVCVSRITVVKISLHFLCFEAGERVANLCLFILVLYANNVRTVRVYFEMFLVIGIQFSCLFSFRLFSWQLLLMPFAILFSIAYVLFFFLLKCFWDFKIYFILSVYIALILSVSNLLLCSLCISSKGSSFDTFIHGCLLVYILRLCLSYRPLFAPPFFTVCFE